MPRAGVAAGTTVSAAFILPPHSIPQSLPCRQVPIGDDLLSRRETVHYDNFALYQNGIDSLNIAFIGKIGHGKSALMKTYLERMLLLPERLADGTVRLRRAVIADVKGEYRRLAELFDCQPVVLGHSECFNPFDDRLSEQQQLAILENFLSLLLDRVLTPFERECVSGAYEQARTTRDPGRPFVLDDVRRALMTLSDEFVATTLRHRDAVNPVAADLAFALKQLTTGSLRGMFDGPTTTALNWSGQIIDITVAPDYLTSNHQLVYQLLVVCLAVWLERAWRSPVDHVDFFVCDEAWDLVKVRQFAQQLQSSSKLGRSRGLSVMVAFHGPSDARSAGNVGEAQVAMAERLLEDVDTFFLFKMSRDDANLLRGVAQLTDADVDTITELDPHQYLLVLGTGAKRRRFLILHRVTADEMDLVDSDSL